MWRYVLKRILLLIPVIIGVTLLVFIIMNLKPGNPGRLILGVEAEEAEVEAYNDKLGLNDPLIKQYLRYIGGFLRGDFGTSWFTGESIGKKLVKMFPTTLKLCAISIVVAMVIGIPIGVLSAVKQYSLSDRIFSISAMILASCPTFFLALMMALIFAAKLHWLPNYGLATWKHYIMPVVATGAATCGMTVRMTRSSMLEEIRADYIRTARAKGAKEAAVIFSHALRNSLIPVVTACGVNFGSLISHTVYVESVFALPGIGRYLVDAVKAKDIPIVMSSVVLLAVCVVIINLLVDVVYAYLDPRIKAKYVGSAKKKAKVKKEAA